MALLTTAEYCFSYIALWIAVSKVHINFAVISRRFKSPSSISFFGKRWALKVICLARLLDIPYFAATREVTDAYACSSASNSATCATPKSVSCLVALLDATLMHNIFKS